MILKYFYKTVSISKIAHYLKAFFIPCQCIFPMCCPEDEGAGKGETGPERSGEKRGRDTKIKFTSFLLSAPCRPLVATEPETLCKLELTSRQDVKGGETTPASLWEYITTSSKTSLQLPLGASPTWEWNTSLEPSRSAGAVQSRESSVRFCQLVWRILWYRKSLKLASWTTAVEYDWASLWVYLSHSGNKWDRAQQQNSRWSHPSNSLMDARADLHSQLAQSLAQGSDEINVRLGHYGMTWCSE